MLLWNILLALAWALLSGDFTAGSVAVGFAVGFAVLRLVHPRAGDTRYFHRALRLLLFVPLFVWAVVRANLKMARDVILPLKRLRPGIIGVPLEARSDAEITALANLITLTPGTLSLDVSADRRTLYIHAMDVSDPEAVRADIKRGLERRVLEVLR